MSTSPLPIFLITREMLDTTNTYVGSVDVTAYTGHIQIEAGLGLVRFATSLSATGEIHACAGTGIEAGYGITAGTGIEESGA